MGNLQQIGLFLLCVLVVVVFSVAWNWKYIVKKRKLKREGEEAIGWAVNVDPLLLRKPESHEDFAGPVGLIFAENPDDGFDPDFMHELIDKCLAVQKRSPEPFEAKIAKVLKKSEYREGVWAKLPKEWTGGAKVIYTIAEVYRDHLPKRRLKWRYVRMKVIFDEEGRGVLHVAYHERDEDDLPYRPSKKKGRPRDDEDDE